MVNAQNRGEIVELLARYGLTPNKRLGQHFLADANIVRKVVRTAGLEPGEKVLEIGAGTGTLTRLLVATGAQVVSYEIDARLRPVLDEVLAGLSVDVRFEDAMEADLARLTRTGDWVMVANLPYNVGTTLVIDALQQAPNLKRLVVMMQTEVAARLVARPGSRAYGLSTVAAGLYADVSVAFSVPPQVFIPPPQVGSSVVVLKTRPAPRLAKEAVALAATAFRQRRKMLRGSLAGVVDAGQLATAGLGPTKRAEELTPSDYLRLAEVTHGR